MKAPVPYNAKDFVSADTGLVLSPGETIKTLREISGLTQEELSDETGIPQTTISAIESGRTKLGAERSKIFAEAFDVHPAVILFSDWRRSAA
ncbi:MAG: helix-turn-helix transcriptional regulator [Granulosicoccaceae bacterium]